MQVILSHAMLEALFAKADARPNNLVSCIAVVEPEVGLAIMYEAGSKKYVCSMYLNSDRKQVFLRFYREDPFVRVQRHTKEKATQIIAETLTRISMEASSESDS